MSKWPAIRSKDIPKLYLVVGAARSGTTFIARAIQYALHDQGHEYLAEIEGEGPLSSLNRMILDHAGGGHWDLPDQDKIENAGAGLYTLMKNYLDSSGGIPFRIFKDPLTSVTLGLWDDVIDGDEVDTYVIGMFRKPARVVNSMNETRKGRPEDRETIVREYNERTLKNIAEFLGLDDVS